MDYYAVIDIGKTNKKVLIYNNNLQIVDSKYQKFEEKINSENIIVEDIENMVNWIKITLKELYKKFQYSSISITTHGATFVNINSNGDIQVPLVAYTYEPGKQFHEDFYKEFGNKNDLQIETATPDFSNLINIGKSIYFLKNKYKEKWQDVKYILNFPQYFGYLLTGNTGAESTYVGCHTYLWNFKNSEYSSVAEKLNIIDKLPDKVNRPWDILGTLTDKIKEELEINKDIIVTYGIHDSNSSLLPYLIKGYDNFILNSTGTWCVAMKPSDKISFSQEELGKVVFYNLSAFNQPVKTTIFLGGMEFDFYSTLLKKLNDKKEFPKYNKQVIEKIIQDNDKFIIPGLVKGTGQFPESIPMIIYKGKKYYIEEVKEKIETSNNLRELIDKKLLPDFLLDYEVAFGVLNLSIAIQSMISLNRAGYNKNTTIFTEGGFRNNDCYNRILTSIFPESNIALTNMKEATSFGAALLSKIAVEKINPEKLADSFSIEQIQVKKETIRDIKNYIKSFLEILL